MMSATLTYYGVQGGRSIFGAQDLEFDRKLSILNKPSVLTTLTEEGEIFDCVDIYKQPAFDHPLLKNHKIQMRPSSQPETLSSYETSSSSLNEKISLEKVLKRFNCPKGTVPIRRTTKEDLIRAQSFSSSDVPGQSVAVLRSKDNIGHPFYGVQGIINVANPTVVNNQFSSGQVWIEAGPSDDINTIQAGWAVAPSLFGDNKTRLFSYWHANPVRGCYNFLCSGFVQVDKDFTVGSVLELVSEYDGPQYAIKILVLKDNITGHWWLQAGASNISNVGYWPRYLFPHMGQEEISQAASFVAWGGLAKSGAGESSPQMGNGHLPDGDYNKACSVLNAQVVNGDYTLVDADPSEIEEYVNSNPNCYNEQNADVAFLFGGPGGDNC